VRKEDTIQGTRKVIRQEVSAGRDTYPKLRRALPEAKACLWEGFKAMRTREK